MKRLILLSVFLLLLPGCAAKPPAAAIPTTAETAEATYTETFHQETEPVDPIQELLESLSIEQRVGQLFLARCQAETALQDIQQYHLGGFVLFGADFNGQTVASMPEIISGYQSASAVPLLIAVDEEGGTVNRISRLPAFRERPFDAPRKLYQKGGEELVLAEAEEKCILLRNLGINVNLGPVCDISTDPSAFMYQRSLGLDPQTTSQIAGATVRLQSAYSLGSVLKHFPGYGNNADTHTAIAVDSRSLEQLEGWDIIPFQAAIRAGAGGIMVSHTIIQALDPHFPASLSPAVHSYIREELGFNGVVLTDDLVMQAITDQYGAAEAAVLAVLAGNDLLCSTEYSTQYEAVLAAVLDGRIEFDLLNAAVRRVLKWKSELGLIP